MFRRLLGIAVIVAPSLVIAPAVAQDFPNRPIKILVGFPAGGPSDVPARIIGAKLQTALGQPVVIENKTGAAGMIALNDMLGQPRDDDADASASPFVPRPHPLELRGERGQAPVKMNPFNLTVTDASETAKFLKLFHRSRRLHDRGAVLTGQDHRLDGLTTKERLGRETFLGGCRFRALPDDYSLSKCGRTTERSDA